MKKIALVGLMAISVLAIATSSMAQSCKLKYKLAPGQKWICSFSSKNESSFMGKKNVNQSKMSMNTRLPKDLKRDG